MKWSEHECTLILISQLKEQVGGKKYHIRAFGNNYDHFCAFSGGGDLQVFTHLGSSAAVVSTEAGESDVEDVLQQNQAADTTLKPPKQGEGQCGSIENKVSRQQSEVDVRLQLQADMVLTCTTLVKWTIEA